MNELVLNAEKIHTTLMGAERIKRNLRLPEVDVDGVVEFCKDKIKDGRSRFYRRGKNWYVEIEDIIITVNARAFTVITAHGGNRPGE
ncbi:MAG: DUF3781 domain-containing protein [Clostridiales bacterium]|jgi:hypothetical protein|nr:DUF3781 domain-containing protein [Clostridiales bacterium]